MAVERQVTVRVNMVAGGNAGAALRQNADAARGAALPFARPLDTASLPFAQPVGAARPRGEGDGGGGISNSAIFKGLAVAVGAIAATGAPFETLMGSVKLLAGEVGMLLIPAVVKVSGFLQDAAGIVRNLNEATGGVLGQIVSFGAVVALGGVAILKLVNIGSGIVTLVQSLLGMTVSANAASAALTKVAVAGAAGGIPGGAVGGGLLGKFGAAAGMAGVGVAASQLVGGAVGGKAGDAIGNIGSGAALGAAIGSMVPVLGTAIGAGLGALAGGIKTLWDNREKKETKAAVSMDFKGGSSAFGDFDRAIQAEAIRDPMQQAHHEQQMRAMEEQLAELRRIRANQPPAPPHPSEANQ